MHETEPFSDVTAPCPDCGEAAIPCECCKPIETVAQLQRALEATGAVLQVWKDHRSIPEWIAELSDDSANMSSIQGFGDTLSEAIESALDAWWKR